MNISLTEGCGNTIFLSISTVISVSIAITADEISSEEGFPIMCAPIIVSFASHMILQTPFPPSFSATNLPENVIASFLTVY